MQLNPFEFNNHNLQKINFNVRGYNHPMREYDFDFTDNNFHRAYLDFMYAIGVGRGNTSPNITFEMFKKYCSVFVLDLQADQCNSRHIHESKSGTVQVELTFRENLAKNIEVCFLAYHDYCLTFKRVEGKPRLVVENINANLLLAEQ